MKFKNRKLIESLLDDVEVDEVNDKENIVYNTLTIKYYDYADDNPNTTINKIITILSKSNFISAFKKPELSGYYRIRINFTQNENASLDDLCKLIRMLYIRTNYISSMIYNNIMLKYSLDANLSTRHDIQIFIKYDFIKFFKAFFPDSSETQILKSFIKSCIKFNTNKSAMNRKWFTLKYGLKEHFVNKDGDFMFNTPCKYVYRFSDGYAIVIDSKHNTYVDENGQFLVLPDNTIPEKPFKTGYALVRNTTTNKYNYIDTTGKVIFNKWYKILGEIKDGIVRASETGKQFFMTLDEHQIFELYTHGHDYEYDDFVNGFAIVHDTTDDTYNLVDKEGNLVSEEYEWFEDCLNFYDGYAVVKFSEDEYNYIDEYGDYLLTKNRRKCCNFNNGFAAVTDGKNQSKWNFVDTSGKEILDKPVFDVVSDFKDGYAVVQIDEGKYNYIDKNGKPLLSDNKFDKCMSFKNGIAQVKSKTQFNFINKKGTTILPNWVDNSESFIIKDDLIVFEKIGTAFDFKGNLVSFI